MKRKPEYPAHHIADQHEPALRRAFVEALGQTIGGHLTLDRIETGLRTNRSYHLTAGAPWLAFTNDLYARLQIILLQTFVGSANAGRVAKEANPRPMPESATAGIRFDLTNPAAIRYAQRYAAELVLDLSQTSQAAVRSIITRMMNGELTPESAARLIRATVGLTPRQAESLERFRRDLEGKYPPPYIDQKVEQYARAKLAERATTIARTEAMRAANAGQQAAWQEAARQGIVPANGVRRMWLTAADELVCPICQPLDGQLTTLDEPWPGGYEPAFVHPNCRCSERLVYADESGQFTTRAPRVGTSSPRPSRSLRPRLRAA